MYFVGLFALPIASSYISQQKRADGGAEVAGMSFTHYAHPKPPAFSIEYPLFWKVLALDPSVTAFSGYIKGNPYAQFYVVGLRGTQSNDLATWLETCCPNYQKIGEPHKGWVQLEFSQKGPDRVLKGVAWQREGVDHTWLLYGVSSAQLFDMMRPVFARMQDSWSPNPQAVTDLRARLAANNQNWIVVANSIVWLLIAGVAVMLALYRSRGPGQLAGTVFVAVFAILLVLRGLAVIATTVPLHLGAMDSTRIPGLNLSGIQLLVATATILLLAWLVATRRLNQDWEPLVEIFLVLMVGLTVVGWMYQLYSVSTDIGGRFTVAQAVVILIALTWDVVMTGGQVTAVRGHRFPRHARILLYFGYVMLVSAAVLYFSSFRMQASGARVASQFESDYWPQSGLLGLGVPMLIALFMIKASAWLKKSAARAGRTGAGSRQPRA
jgi:hypothetical protein